MDNDIQKISYNRSLSVYQTTQFWDKGLKIEFMKIKAPKLIISLLKKYFAIRI